MQKEQMPRENEAKKEEVATMIHRIDATVLFVRDLARCLTFYRDTLGLQVKNSDPDSVAFQMENQYLLLLEISAAADLIRSEANALSIEGGPRVLLAAGVEDVDAAYEALVAKGVTFLRPPNQPALGATHGTLCRSRRQSLGDQPVH